MKIKMLEHYQESGLHLQPDQVCEVDAKLGAWLVKYRKAVEIKPEPLKAHYLDVEPQFEQAEEPPHYGAQAEPEPRHDEIKHQKVKEPRRGRGAK
jgi:hypothetical protein